jgi:hypothetical protein
MAHLSQSDARPSIEPLPMIPIDAGHSASIGVPREDDSLRPFAGPEGFASDAIPGGHPASIPWEQRPLSRHGIVGWTVGAIIGALAMATTVVVAATHQASQVDQVAATHGAEPADIANAVPAPPVTEAAPAMTAPATEATATPLAALPKADVQADTKPTHPHKKAAAATHKMATTPVAKKTLASGNTAPGTSRQSQH